MPACDDPRRGHGGDLACALGPAIKGFKVLVAGPRKRDPLSAAAHSVYRGVTRPRAICRRRKQRSKGIDLGPSTRFVHRMPCGLMRS